MNRDHLLHPTGAAAGNRAAPRKHAPVRQCRHPAGRLPRDRSMAADLQAQVRRAPHAQCGTPLRSAFRRTPGQHDLHTRAARSLHPGSTIFIPGQCNLSDRPSLRTDGRFGRTALMNSPTRPAACRSNNPPLRAAFRGRPLGQIAVFWQLAVSAGTPNRLGRHDPPDGYSKRPSRTRPAAASNSRAVEAKASRRLVTSVARGSESSAIQTDSTPPSVAARRAERSSNSAKSPS